MAYPYSRVIRNSYLGKSKTIKGNSIFELDVKEEEQQRIWAKQEAEKRERDRIRAEIQGQKNKAELLNKENDERINQYQNILKSRFRKRCTIDWESFYKQFTPSTFVYPDFIYNATPPKKRSEYDIKLEIGVPEKSFLEVFSKKKQLYRLEQEKKYKAALEKASCEYDESCRRIEEEREQALKQYAVDRQSELDKFKQNERIRKQEIDEYNQTIDKQKDAFLSGTPDGIKSALSIVFQMSEYPEEFPKEYELEFDIGSSTLVISLKLPIPENFSKIKSYRYVSTTKTIKETEFTKKDFNALYDSMIKQTALRTVYEAFKADERGNIKNVVFNGWIESIDRATGKDYRACIISLQLSRKLFSEMSFSKIEVDACIRNLKALYAGNLAEMAPVKPIMEISANDSRFVASKDIIDNLDSGSNLATMDWEDFEHLVRELFSKYFSADGQEVKVTQSSRDGGVDAIAFDPDPIRGGKFVIQAKRYNRVVPVSAVRDLYGTMINEGAAKGILVTTSYFGSDSREFVKDKPISLIDGSNLIYMFSQYGYDVHIELQNK